MRGSHAMPNFVPAVLVRTESVVVVAFPFAMNVGVPADVTIAARHIVGTFAVGQQKVVAALCLFKSSW